MVAIIKNVAHEVRQLYDGLLCQFAIDIHKGMNIIECIHEEMRIDLILQMSEFRLKLCSLLFLEHELILARPEEGGTGKTGTIHEQRHEQPREKRSSQI